VGSLLQPASLGLNPHVFGRDGSLIRRHQKAGAATCGGCRWRDSAVRATYRRECECGFTGDVPFGEEMSALVVDLTFFVDSGQSVLVVIVLGALLSWVLRAHPPGPAGHRGGGALCPGQHRLAQGKTAAEPLNAGLRHETSPYCRNLW